MTQTTAKSKSKQGSKRRNKEPIVLLALGGFATLMMIAAILLFNQGQPENVGLSASDQVLLVREDSPTLGPADASVTVVEFLDPECEACRAAYPGVKQILQDYDGQIRYVVRYFLNHNNSLLAMQATEAAGEQGLYWEMQELLFERQLEWGEQATPQTDRFIQYAEELGLDVERFTASLQNPAYLEKAGRDEQDVEALALRGTPTFFVNGQMVYGVNEEALRTLIEQELRG